MKSKKVDVITSTEESIRLDIYEGKIPLWEAAKARFEYLHANLIYRLKYLEYRNQELHERLYPLEYLKWHGRLPTMENNLNVEVETEERTRWVPEVIIGGKDGPPPENWLMELERDTVFAARDKNSKNPICQEFQVGMKFKRVVKLIQFNPNSGDEIEVAVDSLTFSRMMDLIERY